MAKEVVSSTSTTYNEGKSDYYLNEEGVDIAVLMAKERTYFGQKTQLKEVIPDSLSTYNEGKAIIISMRRVWTLSFLRTQ